MVWLVSASVNLCKRSHNRELQIVVDMLAQIASKFLAVTRQQVLEISGASTSYGVGPLCVLDRPATHCNSNQTVGDVRSTLPINALVIEMFTE